MKKRILKLSYPPPKSPPGKSKLIILAFEFIMRVNKYSVPPLAVPISSMACMFCLFSMESNAWISCVTCTGAIDQPMYFKGM